MACYNTYSIFALNLVCIICIATDVDINIIHPKRDSVDRQMQSSYASNNIELPPENNV